MRIRYATFLCLGLLTAAQASAQTSLKDVLWEPKIYAGFGGGQFTLENNKFLGFKENATAWELFVGFQFNKYFSVEVGRQTEASPTLSYNVEFVLPPLPDPTATLYIDTYDHTIATHAIHASAIASWPFNETASVYVRGGISNWTTSTHQKLEGVQFYPTPGVPSEVTGSDPFYGLGFAVNIDSGVVRLEYTLSSVDFEARVPQTYPFPDTLGTLGPRTKYQADTSYFWLSVAWKFGLSFLGGN